MDSYRQYVRDRVDTRWFGKLSADDADQDQARDWQAEIAETVVALQRSS
ncbi:hypothetical protein [Rhizocola hellebori]|nr:hypothetical protein [Rhizocola hellebori]